MKGEKKYKKVRNLVLVMWILSNLKTVMEKVPILKTLHDKCMSSEVGTYLATWSESVFHENQKWFPIWEGAVTFFRKYGLAVFVSMVVLHFVIAKVCGSGIGFEMRRLYLGMKQVMYKSFTPRVDLKQYQHVLIINETRGTEDTLEISNCQERKYRNGITFYNSGNRVYVQFDDEDKGHLLKKKKHLRVRKTETWWFELI